MKSSLNGNGDPVVPSWMIRIARSSDRTDVIGLINSVAAEHQYLQTSYYYPTSVWEQAFSEGLNLHTGVLLLVVEVEHQIVGFGRLTTDREYARDRSVGNIGISLTPPYRSRGIGSLVLCELLTWSLFLGFLRLNAAILYTNQRSRNLFQKYGFVVISSRDIYVPFKNSPVEELLFELHVAV